MHPDPTAMNGLEEMIVKLAMIILAGFIFYRATKEDDG